MPSSSTAGVKLDARLLGVALDEHREVRDLLEDGRVERRLQAGGSGVGQQLLGLLDVARPLRDGRIEVRVQREDHMVVGHLALALEELLHHRFAVEGERQRLADALVRELAGIAAHPDLAVVGRLRPEGVEVRVVEEDRA